MSFADKKYVDYYKQKLLWGIPIILALTLLITNYSIMLAIITLSLATIIHVALQQVGIALMLLRAGRGLLARSWKWVNTSASVIIYAMVFPVSLPRFLTHELLLYSCVILLLIASALSFILLWRQRARSTSERWYFIGTALLPIVALVAVVAHYAFIAIVVSRLAHDITAFLFYYTHDYHRNHAQRHNYFARLLSMPVSSYLIAITVFALLLSYTIYVQALWGLAAIYFISMAHYYIESFMWKAGTPHREVMVA